MNALSSGRPSMVNGSSPRPAPPRAAPPVPPPPPARPPVGYHGAVGEFKRRLIEATLAQSGGNRTRAAKALGLQRTYLLRLMREFEIRAPASPAAPRRSSPAVEVTSPVPVPAPVERRGAMLAPPRRL